MRKLLANGDTNTKTRKNGPEVVSAGLSLAPHKSAGIGNVCTDASDGCVMSCINGQGLASVWESIKLARIAKTEFYYRDRQGFLDALCSDLERFVRKAVREEKRLAVRLNMFSDIYWERHAIPQQFPDVMFYDYTKHPGRIAARNMLLPNYHVTFSKSEGNDEDVIRALSSNCNVTVVFADRARPWVGNRSQFQALPKTWRGFRVIDGDASDLRYEDPVGRSRGCVIGLRLKAHSHAARATAINSGFAVQHGKAGA